MMILAAHISFTSEQYNLAAFVAFLLVTALTWPIILTEALLTRRR